ncbi:MAG: chromate transporter [Rhizobacter sp.]|nr:chromate transporter [Rhizobacter sp.]
MCDPTLNHAGYGSAQAAPGPLLTFAACLGAAMTVAPGGWFGGLLVLVAIFVPAFLLVVGALPFREPPRKRVNVQRALAGVDAAVVGILAAALYEPVWTSAIHSRSDFAVALGAFGLLVLGSPQKTDRKVLQGLPRLPSKDGP